MPLWPDNAKVKGRWLSTHVGSMLPVVGGATQKAGAAKATAHPKAFILFPIRIAGLPSLRNGQQALLAVGRDQAQQAQRMDRGPPHRDGHPFPRRPRDPGIGQDPAI
jgi:hypothetical protein